jgi:hypothetical protein
MGCNAMYVSTLLLPHCLELRLAESRTQVRYYVCKKLISITDTDQGLGIMQKFDFLQRVTAAWMLEKMIRSPIQTKG